MLSQGLLLYSKAMGTCICSGAINELQAMPVSSCQYFAGGNAFYFVYFNTDMIKEKQDNQSNVERTCQFAIFIVKC